MESRNFQSVRWVGQERCLELSWSILSTNHPPPGTQTSLTGCALWSGGMSRTHLLSHGFCGPPPSSTWAVYEASCEWARVGGKRVIGLIAFRTRVSLIMLFSLSQSRCLVAALGSSSSYCPSYPCLLRHFPKIAFGATIKPTPPSNPLPLEIVLTEGAEQGSRRRLYLESKGTCLSLWLHCFVPRTSFIWNWTSVSSVTTRRSHIHGTKHEGSDQWGMCHAA